MPVSASSEAHANIYGDTKTSGTDSTTLLVIAGIAAVVVLGLVALFMRK